MSVHDSDLDWFRRHLQKKLGGRRFPFSGSFELTWRCNFQCIHCYLRGSEPPAELPTRDALRLLDQMADAGVIGVSLTGGEPLVREDFARIHTHAVRRGFLVAIFTNASLVDAALADVLAAHPPRTIEVTLYGACPETYQRITGSPAHFDRTVRGIELLVERGLEVRGKAVLLAPLVPEAGRLRELARSLGIGVHLDARVDPTLSGDRSPLALRADPQQAVAAELDDPDRVEQLLLAHRMQLLRDRSQAATPCGAGHSTFHLDPAGRLMPCMLVREPGIDASVQGFEAAWQELGEHERVAFSPDSPCRHCQIQYLCSQCPGLERLDVTARPNQAYHECELARLRARVLEQMLDDHLRLEGADERPPR